MDDNDTRADSGRKDNKAPNTDNTAIPYINTNHRHGTKIKIESTRRRLINMNIRGREDEKKKQDREKNEMQRAIKVDAAT